MPHRYHFGFVLEQALGHITHTQNLHEALAGTADAQISWMRLPFQPQGPAAALPVYRSNWTVRSGLLARRAIGQLARQQEPDALLFHTQVCAMLSLDWMRRIPSVVSLDATPLQYDALGESYGHRPGPQIAERIKSRWHRAGFHAAQHLVAWSAWAARSLTEDYGIPADRISIIPPGVDLTRWDRPAPPRTSAPVRILFVGGDLARKGGHELIDAFRALRDDPDLPPVELHLVTRTAVAQEPGIFAHHNDQPNSRELIERFYQSDIFCLPTHGDCLPMVLAEAGAAGLPLVSTSVAAIPEIVRPGVTGTLVPPRDVGALRAALRELVLDPGMRARLGAGAAALVRAEHDARANAQRMLQVLRAAARSRQEGLRPALLTVSGVVDPATQARTERGERPRADYYAITEATGADRIDYVAARASQSRLAGLIEWVGGPNLLLAWECFRRRNQYRAIITDGEQIGIPLAIMLRLARSRPRARHLMITHVISVPKKTALIDLLGLHRAIDRFIVYATWQKEYIERRWRVAPERVLLSPFMVDPHFFSLSQVTPNPQQMICAVGLERRDYHTLLAAAQGLGAQVIIAAASPWSKQRDTTAQRPIPPNVTVQRYSQFDLRQLYADSQFLVMPLENVTFQAGVTAILEAMAMERAVICTRTPGQTDVVVDEETGIYVPPGDPIALRAAIERLLHNPEEAARMGRAGRRRVEELMSLDRYAGLIAGWVDQATGSERAAPSAPQVEEAQHVYS